MNKCPMCGASRDHLTIESETCTFKRAKTQITYTSVWTECDWCEANFVTPEQATENKRAVIEAKAKAEGNPTPSDLKNWRKRWGLSQKDAGTILGVGPTAFSKYENYKLSPSEPTLRLLSVVLEVDEAVEKLSAKYGIALRSPSLQPISNKQTFLPFEPHPVGVEGDFAKKSVVFRWKNVSSESSSIRTHRPSKILARAYEATPEELSA